MYNIIILDLKFSKDVKELYYNLLAWKKGYNLSLRQCQAIIEAVKEYRPDFKTI